MICDWQKVSLAELAEFRNGKAIAPALYRMDGKQQVFGANGQIARTNELLNSSSVIVIGRVGAYCGSVHLAQGPNWVTDNAIIAEPKPGSDLYFLYYRLKSLDLQRTAIGSAQGLMTQGGLKCITTVCPTDVGIQNQIGRILRNLDDKIELNRKMNETLEAMARAIFKSWFVDFDPVRTKADGRQPIGMDSATAALFPDSFEESELGEIPKGWKVETVNRITEINAVILSADYPLDVIDYIEISEVMRGEIGTIVRYNRGTEPSRARRRLRHGDSVLSTVRPDRGAHFLCLEPAESLIASTGFAVLSPRDRDWAFLYSTLIRREFGEELGRLADGGAYPAIRPDTIGNFKIVIPSNKELRLSFQKLVEPLFMKVHHNRQEAKILGRLRDTLLPKLMSGEFELTVPDKTEGNCCERV